MPAYRPTVAAQETSFLAAVATNRNVRLHPMFGLLGGELVVLNGWLKEGEQTVWGAGGGPHWQCCHEWTPHCVCRLALASAGLAQHDGFMFWLCVVCVMWPTSFQAFFGMRAFPSSTPSPPLSPPHLTGIWLVLWWPGFLVLVQVFGFTLTAYILIIHFPVDFAFVIMKTTNFAFFSFIFLFCCNVISKNTLI